MKELTVRVLVHSAALGSEGDAAAAVLLAADIDNPKQQALAGANDESALRPRSASSNPPTKEQR
ncbi:MAG: hypothetical protein JWR90_1903 [Marmoricola sp.]|jgi:hypothetical protein|nr:hypothetical protein [Marmoricola sp.]